MCDGAPEYISIKASCNRLENKDQLTSRTMSALSIRLQVYAERAKHSQTNVLEYNRSTNQLRTWMW